MDSNRSRARARERRQAEQAKALAAVAKALNRRDAIQEQLDAARADLDQALVAAMDLHTPAHDVRDLMELTPATFWRQVKAARERAAASSR